MSNKIDTVRAKIAALLAKTVANGATEQEAMMAMARAEQMMTEHGISLDDLEDKTQKHEFTLRRFNDGVTVSVIDNYLASAIGRFTDTKVWNSKEFAGFKKGRTVNGKARMKTTSNVMFYGFAVDIELAQYIYKMCDAAMESEWKKFSVKLPVGGRKAYRNSFQIGMAVRLRERLDEMKKQSMQKASSHNQLVVVKREIVERAAAEELRVSDLQKTGGGKVYYNVNAYQAGREAAENVRFNRAVQEGATGGTRLLA